MSTLFWLLKSGVLGACLSCAGSGCLVWSLNPSLLKEKIWTFVIPPDCGSLQPGCGFLLGETSLCLSSPSQCCPFTLCCGGSVPPAFGFLYEGIIPYVVVDLLCLWKEVSSGSSYATILNPPSQFFLNVDLVSSDLAPLMY